MEREEKFMLGGLLLLLVLFAIIIAAAIAGAKNDMRLMAQCIADGRKEYECAAMLKRNYTTTVVPMPVIIPTR